MLRHDSHRPQSQHKHHGLADSAPHHTAEEMKEGERSMLPHSCSIATPSPPESVFSDSTDQIAGVINVGGNGGNARRTAERYCGGEVSPLGSIDYHGRSSSPSPIAVSVGSKTIGITVMQGPVTKANHFSGQLNSTTTSQLSDCGGEGRVHNNHPPNHRRCPNS